MNIWFRYMLTCLLWVSLMMPSLASELRKQIEHNISYFHFQEAYPLISNLPKPAYRKFYEQTIRIYQYLATQDPDILNSLEDNWKPSVHLIEALPADDSLKHIFLSELHGKRAIIEFLSGNYFSTLAQVNASRSALKKSESLYPSLPEALKIQGLFHIAFGAVPKKYQWLTRALGFRGNIQTGLSMLKESYEKGGLLPLESLIMRCYVEKNMRSRPEAVVDALGKVLQQDYPDNMLLRLFQASSYISLKRNEKALHILKNRNQYAQDPNIYFIPFWDYLLGKAHYYKAQYPSTQIYLSGFLKINKGFLNRKDAMFRLGMAHTLAGNYASGKGYFHQIAQNSASRLSEDEYATFMAEKFLEKAPTEFELRLFQARNLFDGGYYSQTLDVLHEINSQSTQLAKAERTELHYRFARVYHTIGNMPEARKHYHLCLEQDPDWQLWLQVYSHYFLAEISRSSGNLAQARTEYKKALSYDKYFYQDGLENRCKVALATLP
ncbi:MAG: hypothetical protein AAF824_00515 [Bacteroidota bacterium]